MSIKNETQHDLTISLWQVGPLYYENVVKPGETFSRNTGAVHFTVKAWLHSPENELDDWSVAKPIIFTTVGSVIGTAAAIPTARASLAFAGGVAAIPAGLSAMALLKDHHCWRYDGGNSILLYCYGCQLSCWSNCDRRRCSARKCDCWIHWWKTVGCGWQV